MRTMHGKKAGLIVITLGIMCALFFLYVGSKNKTEQELNDPDGQQLISALLKSPEEDHVLWEGSHDIVVIEYYNVDCPHCRDLLVEEEKLPDSVKEHVRLVYRMFPLIDLYPQSLERSIITECVSEVSGDMAFFDFLREMAHAYRQNEKTNDWFVNIARRFVNDRERFDSCVVTRSTLEKVNRARAVGYGAGIFSTPSFIVIKDGKILKKFDLLGRISGSRLLKMLAESR